MTKFAPLLALVLVMACGDDDSRPMIMLMDTGTADTGPTPDTGGTADTGGAMDTGSTGMCADPLPALPTEVLPRCAATTLDCLIAATDGPMQQACFDADTTPPADLSGLSVDCVTCFNLQTFSCGAMNGCGSQWADWSCCLDACTGDAMTCQNMCMAQANTFVTCVNGLGAACGAAQQSCFPAM